MAPTRTDREHLLIRCANRSALEVWPGDYIYRLLSTADIDLIKCLFAMKEWELTDGYQLHAYVDGTPLKES
jgi:hypothetical protein